jgi:subtilisin family serine protease
MKKLYIISVFLFTAIAAYCQSSTKFDFYLASESQAYAQGRIDGSEMLQVLVKGNIGVIKELVQANNGVFKYSYGNIAAIIIPVSALPAFNRSAAIQRMEGKPPHIQALNDTMRMHSHIVEVHMGISPLTMPYKGKGVIVGMVDTGIDFVHQDFRDSTGKTRVLAFWDMNQPKGNYTPTPYGYGKSWHKKQIDSVLSKGDSASMASSMDSSSSMDWGHGTHVSGVATGNGRSNHSCIGAAPEADIMMVAYNFTVQTNNEMTDAVNYLFTQADLLGKPCVINASLGDYAGSHDGTDLQAQIIDSMITAKPGRVMVAASGNASNVRYHLGATNVPGDTSFTWFGYNGQNEDIQLWADTANFKNVQFSIGADQVTPSFSFLRGKTGFSTIAPYISTLLTDTVKNSTGQRLGIIHYYGQLLGKIYSMEFVINPDSTNYYWRLTTTGSGKFDCWYPDPTEIIDTALPSISAYPEMKNYKMPDTISTLCSSFQCSSNVITVGDYINRKDHIDYDTVLYYADATTDTVGGLVTYSGVGPTRDGRIKPDITSPGDYCMSVLPTTLRQMYIGNPHMIDSGAHHYLDGGTSTASPGVAGTAALYLQMYPTATNIDVKNAIIYCSTQDHFTGHSLPNNKWGYGKVNAFKALTGCALGVPNITQQPISTLYAYPNPMRSETVIQYDFSSIKEYCTADIVIYDVMGQKVKTIEVKKDKGSVTLDKGSLAAGTYFYSLSVDGNNIRTEKLIVYN